MYELIAAGLVIAAGTGGWFARRILSAAPPSEETMRGIARQLAELNTRLAKVETKLESRGVDNLWQEHRDLAKSVSRVKADVARQDGVIAELRPLIRSIDRYLRTAQGQGGAE